MPCSRPSFAAGPEPAWRPTSVDVHAAVGGVRNGGAHSVGDAHRQGAARPGILERLPGEGGRCFVLGFKAAGALTLPAERHWCEALPVDHIERSAKCTSPSAQHHRLPRVMQCASMQPTCSVSAVSPDWETKTQQSSRKMGVRRSSRSEASSSATGMLTRSSTVCLLKWGQGRGQKR